MDIFKREEPCSHDNCAVRSFYIGEDGYTYCRQGHQQTERGTVIAEDIGELIALGRKHKRAESETETITSARSASTGPQPFEALLLCLQLILRKQVRWLIQTQGIHADFETVVKDLWTIQISRLKPPATLYADSTDDDTQQFSSQSEPESSADTRSRSSLSSRRTRRRGAAPSNPPTPNLIDLLAVLYIAALITRSSITIGDLYRWTSSGELLYYQSSRQVPHSLRSRLGTSLNKTLDPGIWLKPSKLHRVVCEKISLFMTDNGLRIPAINRKVIIFRWTTALAVPLEAYACTDRILKMLGLTISYEPSEMPAALRLPEVLLMAVLVVSVKLLFPLDDIERRSWSPDDLTALQMDWTKWYTTMSDQSVRQEREGHTFRDYFEATEQRCLQMADKDLDQYLNWYQDNIASEYVKENGRAGRNAAFKKALMSMFPDGTPRRDEQQHSRPLRSTGEQDSRTLRQTQSQLTFKPPVRRANSYSSNIHRVGYHYRVFHNVDDLQEHTSIRLLYQLAADICAIEIKPLTRAVALIERQLSRLQQTQTGA